MKTKLLLLIVVWGSMLFACSGQEGKGDGEGGGEKPFASSSKVMLHSLFQSNMVLQQNSRVPLRGTEGAPGQPVRVICSWEKAGENRQAEVSADGTWEIIIPTPAAGGPYNITVQGKNTVTLTSVMMGEVWLCAGQSNMQMQVSEVSNSAGEIATSSNNNIRLFNIKKRVQSDVPVDNVVAAWEICNPASVPSFSAAGYFFGRKLNAELGVPVGLINASWGSTPAEVWTRREAVMNDPILAADAQYIENAGGTSPFRAGNVYNAMIHPLRRFPIAGVIWYQGENNQSAAGNYGRLLTAMIGDWRKVWGVDIPFYIAQICPRHRQWDYRTVYSNPLLRFQQMLVGGTVANSGVEVNDDIADLNDTHPKNKQDVGLRLASLALARTYGKESYAALLCPVYEKMETEGSSLKVYFKYAAGGLTTADGQAPSCFEIAGSDNLFKPATAVISGGSVILSHPDITAPVAARLGWSYYRTTNLTSMQGMPVSVFKTYDWTENAEEPKP